MIPRYRLRLHIPRKLARQHVVCKAQEFESVCLHHPHAHRILQYFVEIPPHALLRAAALAAKRLSGHRRAGQMRNCHHRVHAHQAVENEEGHLQVFGVFGVRDE
ncbi:hypothetical protein GOP47_0003554 [Adiantum capillus-veneris]|uniref:Uncharacterized protein n=1 Tax=Adiantum capillus-veneris TaxID=13818 RepID=A0A9D4VDT9_ADICA|nr:hypothetical protein GOP47_0003554 [Adiantum capillus-veneris]